MTGYSRLDVGSIPTDLIYICSCKPIGRLPGYEPDSLQVQVLSGVPTLPLSAMVVRRSLTPSDVSSNLAGAANYGEEI